MAGDGGPDAVRDLPERALDDTRLLRLLWRGEERPSARSGLSVGGIVAAGVEVADEAGLDAVSMRRVADRLGVGAMSLYTYIPAKRDLVMLMVDEVVGELSTDPDADSGWRERLHAMARQHWDLYGRHPWLLDVPLTRPVTGPNSMQRYEHELGIVDGLGLDDIEMDATIELVGEHVAGAARRLQGISRDVHDSGLSDDEWWWAILPTLEQVLANSHLPLSARVGEAIGAAHLDTSYLLDYGLDRILDGVEALLASRTRPLHG